MKKQLTLRLNEVEYKELTDKAQAVNMKKEPYIRLLIMGQIENNKLKNLLIEQLTSSLLL